jgi:hypothetical protein
MIEMDLASSQHLSRRVIIVCKTWVQLCQLFACVALLPERQPWNREVNLLSADVECDHYTGSASYINSGH